MKLMTPGPTQVRENVRMARAKVTGNPDLEADFYNFYRDTCRLLSNLLHTDNESFILGGEGILGLEAACAALTEPGDRVLVLDNGIFGKGFADFVHMYGGKPVLYTTDYHCPMDPDALRGFLEHDHAFKYATLVHCDTPSGVMNDIHTLCPMLKEYGILTVVDSVAGMFGEYVHVDQARIDILCGGSQKALSAPAGLTMLTVSDDAKNAIKARKIPIRSFYANIRNFFSYYEDQWFPYTMPISDIVGLRQALDNVAAEPGIIDRHARIASAVCEALAAAGLELYLSDGFSNNVTVFCVPEGLTDREILDMMKQDYGILIAGCFDVLAGKVLRIGHMGENANIPDVAETLDALGRTLVCLGMDLRADMKSVFLNALRG